MDFRRSSDLYEHMNRLHDREQIVEGNDEKNSKEKVIEKRKEIVEIKIEPMKQNECESEEEQIDVVSTKLDEFSGAREIKS